MRVFFHLSLQPPFLTRAFHLVSAQWKFIERIKWWRGTRLGRHFGTWGTRVGSFPSSGLHFPLCAQCAPFLKFHYSIVSRGIAFRATECQAVPMATTGSLATDVQCFSGNAPGRRGFHRPSNLPQATQRQIIWSVFSPLPVPLAQACFWGP